MIHVRIDSVNDIPFDELKSNYITASITLFPIEISRPFYSILESPTGYSHEIVSFPISDPQLYTVRISLQSKRESVYDFCEVNLALRYFRVNRYYKFRAQTDSKTIEEPPSIDLSIQISSSKYKPFECHRSHVSFVDEENDANDDNNRTIDKNEIIARYWFSIVPEDQWSLIFRPGILDLLKEEIEHFGINDDQNRKQHENQLKKIRKGERHLDVLDQNPLSPPSPTNEPLPQFIPPSSMTDTKFI